jgi:hypothetical protein
VHHRRTVTRGAREFEPETAVVARIAEHEQQLESRAQRIDAVPDQPITESHALALRGHRDRTQRGGRDIRRTFDAHARKEHVRDNTAFLDADERRDLIVCTADRIHDSGLVLPTERRGLDMEYRGDVGWALCSDFDSWQRHWCLQPIFASQAEIAAAISPGESSCRK